MFAQAARALSLLIELYRIETSGKLIAATGQASLLIELYRIETGENYFKELFRVSFNRTI